MKITDLLNTINFVQQPTPKLELVFPKFVYSKEFNNLFDKKNKLIECSQSEFNNLNWKLYPDGLFGLICDEVKKLYIEGEFKTNIIAYFNLHYDIYRLSNVYLLELSNKFDFDKYDKHEFLMNFDSSYKFNQKSITNMF
jgi:hypothetical protein